MDNLKERLTAKLGPLPVWAWGLIAAVLAFIAYLYYSRNNSNASTVIDPADIPTIDGSGYQTVGIKGGSGVMVSDEPDTNQKWLNRASKAVADALGASPSEVYNALTKWLQGQDHTAREQTFIDRAIQLVMMPPEGTYGTGNRIPDPTDAIQNPNPTRPPAILNPVTPLPPVTPSVPNVPNRTAPVVAPSAPVSVAPPTVNKGYAETLRPKAPPTPKPVKGKAQAIPAKPQAPKGKNVRV